ALDEEQKKIAYQEKPFAEIQGKTRAPQVGAPVGLPTAKMTPKQRGLLMKLLQAYTARMSPDVAESEMSEVNKAGIDQIYFAYNGGLEAGKGHTYRVQGPTFVIEFLNVQKDSAGNAANHIHSGWRNVKGDFGLTN